MTAPTAAGTYRDTFTMPKFLDFLTYAIAIQGVVTTDILHGLRST
jgi:hypothetical protein